MNLSDQIPSPAISLDCRGQLCPVPILLTEEKIQDLKKGEVLEVLYTDPGAKPDLDAWCRMNRYTLVAIRENKREYKAYIRK